MRAARRRFSLACATTLVASGTAQDGIDTIPSAVTPRPENTDWLLDPAPFRAQVFRTDDDRIVLDNGLIRRTFASRPNGATIAFDQVTSRQSLLRGVKPEASITIDGEQIAVGGLLGQPNYAFLTEEWIARLTTDPSALQLRRVAIAPLTERMAWKRVRHHDPLAAWPPPGITLTMSYGHTDRSVEVDVVYALYDGVPCVRKHIVVRNTSERSVRLDAFASEILAAVEYDSQVEPRDMAGMRPPNLHVETDYACGGGTALTANQHVVHWVADPDYSSQVNYRRLTPCLLRIEPGIGPGVEIAPRQSFTSFHTWVVAYDSYERERQGLTQRRVYRTIAPWITENPLMMHVRSADHAVVRNAIDQCAEVGFEMAILTFGSGFNVEDPSDANIERWREHTEYARARGIEIGGYSLLSSRSISAEHNVVMPEGQRPRFGNAPCLCSQWGEDYFHKLYRFYQHTGFRLLEHDGSYPGDPCTSTTHPGHLAFDDSRWKQSRRIKDFYAWCRATGVYLNVPDYYYLAGSNKCGMGYREVNWSLPRDQQVIHTRQNIYDGTWQKTPTMGWMFVPLTQYHGGGAAATIEPLREHLGHYERMLSSNLALGVQACYRGPRLYDTDETKAVVKRQVDWFKRHRAILESDVIHGRRADGRDVDWMLHVNPQLEEKAMLVAFNPLATEVTRTLRVDLYYAGFSGNTTVRFSSGEQHRVNLDGSTTLDVSVTIPARGMEHVVFSD